MVEQFDIAELGGVIETKNDLSQYRKLNPTALSQLRPEAGPECRIKRVVQFLVNDSRSVGQTVGIFVEKFTNRPIWTSFTVENVGRTKSLI